MMSVHLRHNHQLLLSNGAVTVRPLMTRPVTTATTKICSVEKPRFPCPRENNFRIYCTNSPPFATKQKSTLSPRQQNLNAYLHSKMSTVLKHRTRLACMSDNSINLERKREQKTRIEN